MQLSFDLDSRPAPKPLGLLGRDEMNLAEFPITLLTDRVPKDQQEAVYQDEIFDERTGLTLTRKLTITAGNHGLTTPVDDEIILALIQLTRQKNNFTDRKVEFSRHELIQLLGWSVGGAKYERIGTSLDRWTSVYLKYENAWRDNRTKSWTTVGFHIIDKYEITDNRSGGDLIELMPSYIVWGEDIFASFQAGYLKPLDYDLCMGLHNSTAKRMYRFLDKRFHHKADWTFDLKELAHEHIGLGRHYEGPAHLKRNLEPAIAELESVGFLEPLPEDRRFIKDGKGWKIRLASPGKPPAPPEGEAEAPAASGLAAELVQRGVTQATAVELVQRYPAQAIEAKLEVYDWLVGAQDKRVGKNPPGFLVKSITGDYAVPRGFITRAEQQQRQEARQADERDAAEERRSKLEQDALRRAERQSIAAYRSGLTKEQLSHLEAEAIARADPATRKTYDETRQPDLKRMILARISDDHIRRLLQDQSDDS